MAALSFTATFTFPLGEAMVWALPIVDINKRIKKNLKFIIFISTLY